MVEGDGSAWDTTCKILIRADTENIVLNHVMTVLIGKGVCPEVWQEEHERVNNEKKALKLFFQKAFEKTSFKIPPIRRSGHRGTSCLNWWDSQCTWLSSIFKGPARFLDIRVKKGEDLTTPPFAKVSTVCLA